MKNLCAGYRGEDVLRGVTLAFRPGEVLALLGPNGCGKSPLLKAALGMIDKAGGEGTARFAHDAIEIFCR